MHYSLWGIHRSLSWQHYCVVDTGISLIWQIRMLMSPGGVGTCSLSELVLNCGLSLESWSNSVIKRLNDLPTNGEETSQKASQEEGFS